MVPPVLRENRNQSRPPRLGRSLLCGALIWFVAGCGPQQTKPDDGSANPIDPAIFAEYSKLLLDYIDALMMLDSPNPRDWADGKRKIEAMNFSYFKEDRFYFQQFCEGDAVVAENARKELARRGKMLNYVLVFTKGYAPATWEHARTEMLKLGEGAPEFLTISLLKLLRNGRFKLTWPQIRFQLIAVGDVALETSSVLARQLAEEVTSTAIAKWEVDLVQIVMVLIGFGEKGRPVVQELARHKTWNVRKVVAKAIGESIDVTGADIAIEYVKNDPEWQVKAAAAEALGHLKAARNEVGPVLIECMKAEKDPFVRKVILQAIGRTQYLGAIPFLMNVLDVPDYNVVEMAMEALYSITGERITTANRWKAWYRDIYPTWIKTQKP